ncbi:MAG: Nif3-like dinuclear metal center hexameric protein, partial [Bacteroidales bacterium]|nr:Nif3-like dinuclear metal center hexameric protein [Bacteroidales bacterium]
MKAFEIAQVIEKFAPLGLQENWDNSGFCIGDPNADVTKLLIGFDPSYELIEEAVRVGADMVVTHHPLIFSGVKKISGADQTGRAIIEAIKNDIVVYSCHTNMDKVIAGVSGSLAQKLNLKDVQVLDSDENGDGLGVIGRLEQPMDADDFLAYLKNSLSLEHFRYSKPVSGKIERVALCGGSGRPLIKMAYRKGA